MAYFLQMLDEEAALLLLKVSSHHVQNDPDAQQQELFVLVPSGLADGQNGWAFI